MKTQEEVVRGHAVGPINIYRIYQEGYQDRELDDRSFFRREAAKDFTVALVSSGSGLNPKTISYAIEMADELIAKLKEK